MNTFDYRAPKFYIFSRDYHISITAHCFSRVLDVTGDGNFWVYSCFTSMKLRNSLLLSQSEIDNPQDIRNRISFLLEPFNQGRPLNISELSYVIALSSLQTSSSNSVSQSLPHLAPHSELEQHLKTFILEFVILKKSCALLH